MSIKAILRNALLVTALLILISIAATLYGNYLASSSVTRLAFTELPAAQTVQGMVLEYERLRKYEKEYFVFATNPERRANYEKEWEKAYAALVKRFTEARAASNEGFSAAEKSKILEWNGAVDSYASGFRQLIARVSNGTLTDGIAANAENGKNVDYVRPFGKEAPDLLAKQVAGTQAAAKGAVTTVRNVLIAIVVLQVLVVFALFWVYLRVPKAIGAVITEFSDAVDKMSKGDIKSPLPDSNLEEFEPLSNGLARLQKSLSIAMDRLRNRA